MFNALSVGTITLTNSLASFLQSAQSLTNIANSVFGGQDLDFVVAVVPPGGLGKGVEGANLALRRSVILVDESKPSATFHEMGHAIGLYTSTEQYDLFPPDGMFTNGCTIFKKEDAYTAGFAGDSGRIMHLPGPDYSWWYSSTGFMDFMSKEDVTLWPTATTWSAFFDAFRSRLSRTRSAEEKVYPLPLPAGMRALLLQAAVRHVDGQTYYEFLPGSITACPLEGVDQNTFVTFPPPAGIEDKYEFSGYTAEGFRYDYQAFRLVPNNGEGPETDLWWGTLLIANSSVVRYEITRSSDNTVVFQYLPGGPLTTTIQSPASGTTINGDITLRWNTTANKTAQGITAAPTTHMIYMSSNNGATWQLLFPFLEAEEVIIPSDLIPTTDELAFRVLACDGLQTAVAEVKNLHIPNHPPHTRIFLPVDGDHAPVDTPWSLKASAWDADQQVYLDGNWTSSIDGPLGIGNVLDEVILSAGNHILTFRSLDELGHAGESQVAVSVGPTPDGIDLRIEKDALSLRPPDYNPNVSQANVQVMETGEHTLRLRFRNQGFPATVSLRLYIEQPGITGEALLVEQEEVLAPFEETQVEGSFNASGQGPYRIRGIVESTGTPDPEPGNNQHLWVYDPRHSCIWIVY